MFRSTIRRNERKREKDSFSSLLLSNKAIRMLRLQSVLTMKINIDRESTWSGIAKFKSITVRLIDWELLIVVVAILDERIKISSNKIISIFDRIYKKKKEHISKTNYFRAINCNTEFKKISLSYSSNSL